MAAGIDVREALQGTSRGTTGRGRRVRSVLVSCEVALAVALVIVMTMLAKSFTTVQAIAPGFEPRHVLTARLTLPARRYTTRDAVVTFERALAERLMELPTVTHAGAVSLLPLSGLLARIPFTVDGRPMERARIPSAQYRVVSPGYFETLRIPVIHGRAFSEFDTDTTRPVAIVNDELARQWLTGINPVGARLLVDDNDGPPRPVEIIGVVGNVRQIALDSEPTWDIYLPYAQVHPDNVGAAAANMFWGIRTSGDPMSLAAATAAAVRRIDPDVVAAQIRPMEMFLADSIAPRRFSLSLMTAFAVAALVLAGTGIYAVTVFSIRQRTREINIRLALGARRSNIVRLVTRQYSGPIAAGLAAGIGLAAGATRFFSTMLFGMSAIDVGTAGGVAGIVAAIAFIACAVPTLRAGRGPTLDLERE
jgi:putative ABC transport system permease protein